MTEVQNLFAALPEQLPDEVFEQLLQGDWFRLERIVSTGQATPQGQWYDQANDEWVVLLRGAARLTFDAPQGTIDLLPGDYVRIAANRRHRVEWTHPSQPTVWLALHYRQNLPTS